MSRIVINGDFYDLNVTGVQRYATEIIKKLDEICEKKRLDIEVLVPENIENIPHFKNIRVTTYKKKRKIWWQQVHLMKYCKKNKAICLCLCSNVPFFYARKSIQVVHDVATLEHPEFYSKKYLLMNKILLWGRIKKLLKVITVSDFSKNEISRYTGLNKDLIYVVENAWQHMNNISYDDSVFTEFCDIKKGNYFFSLSSLSPNKNFYWIIEIARRNPEEIFVISGMKLLLFSEEKFGIIPKNVIFTGYISDEQMKSLMKECKAFLFPTLYEGFGVPPLEAISQGTKVIISDTPCMKEIYGESAVYINPYKYDYDLKSIINTETENKSVLEKYSWEKSAKKLYNILVRL